MGKLSEALIHYTHALQINPDSADLNYYIGDVLAKNGKLYQAVYHYKAALRIQYDFSEAHNSLGAALARLGNLDEAMRHFQEALRLKPNNPGAIQNLNQVVELRRSKTGS